MVVDKPLDAIVKENQKKRRQAKTAAAKAKIAKGKKNQQRGRTGKARDNAPVRGRGGARGNTRGGRGGNRQVANNRNQNQNNKRGGSAPTRGGRGGGRGGRGGPTRASIPKQGIRSASSMAKADQGLKVHVDNLDFGVTEKDMQELFSEFGRLKKVQLHYDSKGKSQGNCDLFFARKGDGIRAIKKYNNVPLDGRKMRLEVVGAPATAIVNRISKPKPAPKQQISPAKKKKLAAAKPKGKGPIGKNRPEKGAQKGAKGKPGQKKKLLIKKKGGAKKEDKPKLTEEQLDKQLDAYLTKGASII